MAKMKVITGPMFSGKTEELLRILHRSSIADKRIVVIKPKKDTRSKEEIVSRRTAGGQDKNFTKSGSFPALPIETADELDKLIKDKQPDILGVDEAQFFDEWFFEYIVELLRKSRSKDLLVLVAGLDMDAWGRPFGVMPQLMAVADEVQKETAICFNCKQPALFTLKLVNSDQQVEVGDSDIYEARCRVCHVQPGMF